MSSSVALSALVGWFLALTIKHVVADFFLQTHWMAIGKDKAQGWARPLLVHCLIHGVLTTLIVAAVAPRLWFIGLVDFAIHITIDRVKGFTVAHWRVTPDHPAFWWLIGVDQALHHLTGFALAILLAVNLSSPKHSADSNLTKSSRASQMRAVVNPSLGDWTAISLQARRGTMSLNQNVFDDDSCPVREDLLGEMYRASENGLPVLVETVSSDVRAMLALFCYKRSHLHGLALTIAASCSERDLIRIGGRVGSSLYAQARETPAARQPTPSYGHRKPITLSTKPLSTLPPLIDDLDDDIEADVPLVPSDHAAA